MKALTERQGQVLAYLQQQAAYGMLPTIREMSLHFGVSPGGTLCHVQALERKGYLTRVKGKSRNIRLLPRSAT